jgi:hypothetical protein
MAELVSTVAIGEPIYALSTNVFPAFPVVNLGRAIWPYHYNCLWPLPALYAGEGVAAPAYRRASEQGAVERVFFDTVVDDVLKTPPRLLIVDRARFKQAMGRQQFDFLEYFSGSPAFRTLLRRYRNLGYIGQWEIYKRDG